MHASVCDIILDCFQNSVEAKASLIELSFSELEGRISVSLKDNGCGMSAEVLKSCTDPWYTDGIKHKARKVGLGLPFLYQTIEMTEGTVSLESEPGQGTQLSFSLDSGHLDSPPAGDLVTTLVSCFLFEGEYEVIFSRSFQETGGEIRVYELKRSDLLEVLGDFSDIGSLTLLESFIESQEEDIKE